jgi:hypothetical protein
MLFSFLTLERFFNSAFSTGIKEKSQKSVFRIRIRIQLVAWIRILFPNADPDPEGLKRAQMNLKKPKDR